MAKKKKKVTSAGPQVAGAIEYREYSELTEFSTDWADGAFNLAIVVGRGGVGKSRTFKEAVGNRALWIKGNSSAFGMYKALYANKDRPVVIDDVDKLWSNDQCVNLLKLLCEDEIVKRLDWTTAAAGDDKEVPRNFETTSRVAIICNDWSQLNANVGALEDRGQLVLFNPSQQEVHRQAAEFFWDQELYEDIGRHLHLFPGLTLRLYLRAAEWKKTGKSWLKLLQREGYDRETVQLIEILNDDTLPTVKAKEAKYREVTGTSRATFYNRKKRLDKLGKKRVDMSGIKVKKRKAPWDTAEAKKRRAIAEQSQPPRLRVVGG